MKSSQLGFAQLGSTQLGNFDPTEYNLTIASLAKTLDGVTISASGVSDWQAVPWLDDFEDDLSEWNEILRPSVVYLSDIWKHSGTKSVYIGEIATAGANITKYISSIASLTADLWVNLSVGTLYDTVIPFLTFNSESGIQIAICTNNLGGPGIELQARLGGATGTVLGSSGPLSFADVEIAVDVVIDGTDGVVNVRHNGTEVISYVGNTKFQTENYVSRIVLGSQGAWIVGYYDDLSLTEYVQTTFNPAWCNFNQILKSGVHQ